MITATLLCWLALGTISFAGLPFADWVQVAGNGVRSARVAADSDGNCFVVGTFGKYSSNGEISFGDTTLVTRGLDDVFVAKYDSNGQVQWVRQLVGAGSDSETASSPSGLLCRLRWWRYKLPLAVYDLPQPGTVHVNLAPVCVAT